MNKIRTMHDREKYLHAFGMVSSYQKHVMQFIEDRLGYEARFELGSVWQAAITAIRKDYPEGRKYEAAYCNWEWMARSSHDYLADVLVREDVADYKRLLLRHYSLQHDNPGLPIMRLLRNHVALAKMWAYEMQWMTPIELTSSSKEKVVCTVHACKILQTPDTERICRVDCRNVGAALLRNVYHLKRVDSIEDQVCTITLSPLDN